MKVGDNNVYCGSLSVSMSIRSADLWLTIRTSGFSSCTGGWLLWSIQC